jgi:hypothetical protein
LNADIVMKLPEVSALALPQMLPACPPVKHKIELITSSKPFFRYRNRLSTQENEQMQVVVEELLGQGFIRSIMCFSDAPVQFAPKTDGKLRFCIDYRVLNKQTTRNCHLIPKIIDLNVKTQGSNILSIVNLCSAYH